MPSRARVSLLVGLALIVDWAWAWDRHGAGVARAQPEPAEDEPTSAELAGGEEDFGPLVEIERIDIHGRSRTAEKLVRRALLVREGDRLHSGDPRFLASRYRVLALGHFRNVTLKLDKGSRRGAIVLTLLVEERETATLNRIFLGTSELTDVWLGLDAGDTNLLGTGVAVSGAFVWASAPELEGGEDQAALRLRVADPSLFGSRLGARGTLILGWASEPDGEVARRYRRAGGVAGVTFDLSSRSAVAVDGRVESVKVTGAPPPGLLAGTSLVTSAAAGFDLDRRTDPVLPADGDRLALAVEAGAGDYDFVRAQAEYSIWRRLAGRHIGSLHLAAGIIGGDPPLFDRFHVGDLNPLLAPRPLELVVSTRPSPDFFGSGIDEVRAGRVAGTATLEYTFQLFRRARTVHGGDLFAQVGVLGVGETDHLPLDLTFNLGLRLDTVIGVFELSLGNALGRIPF
jgi:outer membrane protein insertion porin family